MHNCWIWIVHHIWNLCNSQYLTSNATPLSTYSCMHILSDVDNFRVHLLESEGFWMRVSSIIL
jgi:hypothetical protein